MDALNVWARALRHFNQRGYIYIWGNLWCVVCSLPLVTAPAAWAGLIRLSRCAYTSPAADLSEFWDGLRENLGRGLLLGVVNLAVVLVNITNLAAYRSSTGTLYDLLRAAWVLALIAWFGLQFYLWPLFYQMQQPSLLGALRNAAVMVYLNPFFTLLLWAGVLLVVVISTLMMVPWLLLTVSLLAALATGAVFDRLERAGHETGVRWSVIEEAAELRDEG